MSPAKRDALFNILTGTDAEAMPLRELMVDFVGANAEHYKLAEERRILEVEQIRREKEAVEQENANIKKQMEQEAINANNKRARPNTSATSHYNPFTFNTTPSIKKETVVTPTKVEQPAPPQQQQQQQRSVPTTFSFLEEVKVTASMPINNDKVNSLVNHDPRETGFQKRNDYATKSSKMASFFEQYNTMCNPVNGTKKPSFG